MKKVIVCCWLMFITTVFYGQTHCGVCFYAQGRGYITGETSQCVKKGEDTSPVTANSYNDECAYTKFIGWYDYKDNTLITKDETIIIFNVQQNMNIIAKFKDIDEVVDEYYFALKKTKYFRKTGKYNVNAIGYFDYYENVDIFKYKSLYINNELISDNIIWTQRNCNAYIGKCKEGQLFYNSRTGRLTFRLRQIDIKFGKVCNMFLFYEQDVQTSLKYYYIINEDY